MDPELMKHIEQNIQTLLRKESQDNFFDRFIDVCKNYYDKPVHNFAEMRMRNNKKHRGDIFEHFCLKYLTICKDFNKVWLLKDVPDDILTELNLKRNDVGIDLLCKDSKDRYYAVQAKYRKRNAYKKVNVLGWKQLSTFYALVYRTGPYFKHIVMTNANCVRHVSGKKTKEDWSICLKSFQNIKRDQWLKMANIKQYSLQEKEKNKESEEPEKEIINEPKKKKLTQSELREKRLAFFNK